MRVEPSVYSTDFFTFAVGDGEAFEIEKMSAHLGILTKSSVLADLCNDHSLTRRRCVVLANDEPAVCKRVLSVGQ